MAKHLNGWEMSKKIKNCKIYVQSFPGAKVQCMDDYKKSSIRDKPDHFIIHIGTNLYLIDNTKKFRSHHLNKGKLYLNRKGSKLLNDTFIRQQSHVLN